MTVDRKETYLQSACKQIIVRYNNKAKGWTSRQMWHQDYSTLLPTYPQRAKLVFEVRLCKSDGAPTSDVCVLQFCHKIVHYLENRTHKLRTRELSGYRNSTIEADPLSEVGLKCVTSII